MAKKTATSPPPDPRIPFIDLSIGNQQVRADSFAAMTAVAEHGRFINGPEVARLEASLASYLGATHAIGVSSGTDALLMSLMALDLGTGDEVITTPFTFIATAGVLLRLGLRPVFADIDPVHLAIQPQAVRALIGPRTRAILPVHLFGRMCAVGELRTLADQHGLTLIEDCAQSLGASLRGRSSGTFGHCGAFSFFPTKNLGGWGDGGLIGTSDDNLDARLRKIREHGGARRDWYECMGGNFRLDTLQAAVLEVKLRHLDEWLLMRRKAAHAYLQLFSESGLAPGDGGPIQLPDPGDDREHSFSLFVIQADERDDLKAHLERAGIGTAVYYPTPLHLQPVLHHLGYRAGSLPVAEKIAARVLALPFYPEIRRTHQERVVTAIAAFYTRRV
jgi:dTDP-4-amino-4,6-dideoxygalactose transaminase